MQTTLESEARMDARRAQAVKRLKAKNDFKAHLLVYLAVNAMLVLAWTTTSSGYFWPIWPMAG